MIEQIALDAFVDALRDEVTGRAPATPDLSPAALEIALVIARQNKVLSLVQERLRAGRSLDQSLADTTATLVVNSHLLQELSALVPRFQDAGLRFLVIKGPVQQRQIHGTFFQRPSADLDILVRAENFPRARQLLVELGYTLATPSVWWRSVLGEEHFHRQTVPHIAVDLHHRVHQPGAPAFHDTLRLFADTETVAFGGIDIPTLNASNAMLLCTISIAKALYNREPSAAYLCDLYVGLMAAAPATVNSFLLSAQSTGLGGHAALALALMDSLFDHHSDARRAHQLAFAGLTEADLLRVILVPRDPMTRWPRRRDMLWELCERRPVRYGREFARVLGSELTRRLFERGAAA